MNLKETPIVYILVDKTKKVNNLGEKCPVPVECDIDMIEYVSDELKKMGATECNLRKQKDSGNPFVSDNGKYIIDAKFTNITEVMEKRINGIKGVLENGLFIGYDNIKIIES